MTKAETESKQFEADFRKLSDDAAKFRSALYMVKSNLAARHHDAITAKVKLLEFERDLAMSRPKRIA